MILRPSRHSHPDQTVMHVSALILSQLVRHRVIDFTELVLHAKQKVDGGENLIPPALDFLFLLGLIAYHPKNDTIEYLRREQS